MAASQADAKVACPAPGTVPTVNTAAWHGAIAVNAIIAKLLTNARATMDLPLCWKLGPLQRYAHRAR